MHIHLADMKTRDGKLELNVLDRISQEDVNRLYQSQIPVSEYIHIKNLYKITISNGDELKALLKSIYSNDESIRDLKSETLYLESNRLIANYCSFIGMFIDQTEKVLSKKDKEKLKEFRKTTNRLYDEKFEYRFFVLLRNFIMHYSLPFTQYQKDFNGKRLYFNKSHLLGFSKWKHVKNDLEKMDEKIDILPFIQPMNIHLAVLLYTIVYNISKDILQAYQEASDFVIKHKVKAPAIVRYENIEEFKKGNLNYNPINFKDMQEAFDDVKNHPNINLKINDITPDWLK